MEIKTNDKIVIRNDLEVSIRYGKLFWNGNLEYLKELEFVIVKGTDDSFIELSNGWWITVEMVECIY